jgi:Holliday junction resolvase RusA-like endonuclease
MKNKSIFFSIPGNPVGKQRHRTAKNHTYTPRKTKEYENKVKLFYRLSCKNKPSVEPIAIYIESFHPVPKSDSKKKKELKLSGKIKCTVKPDADNIAKIICDALNKVAYKDDSQVYFSQIYKSYSIKPRVEVTICEDKNEV